MESQKRYPEKYSARKAILWLVQTKKIPKARELDCIDCDNPAACYDHAKGYKGKNKYYVEPVCWKCHIKRGKKRKEYRNGSMKRPKVAYYLTS